MEILIPILTAIVTVATPIILGLLAKLLVKYIQSTPNQTDDRLAGMAVSAAEDFFGKGQGNEKLNYAINLVKKLSKGHLKDEEAEALVRSAYQHMMGELSKVKN
jgi:hypothetical protein